MEKVLFSVLIARNAGMFLITVKVMSYILMICFMVI